MSNCATRSSEWPPNPVVLEMRVEALACGDEMNR
jgi:hypothetical protein